MNFVNHEKRRQQDATPIRRSQAKLGTSRRKETIDENLFKVYDKTSNEPCMSPGGVQAGSLIPNSLLLSCIERALCRVLMYMWYECGARVQKNIGESRKKKKCSWVLRKRVYYTFAKANL